jgi:hypothetical protein
MMSLNTTEKLKIFEKLTHQELWESIIKLSDGSVWRLITLSEDKNTAVISHLKNETLVGCIGLDGHRVARIKVTDVKELFHQCYCRYRENPQFKSYFKQLKTS